MSGLAWLATLPPPVLLVTVICTFLLLLLLCICIAFSDKATERIVRVITAIQGRKRTHRASHRRLQNRKDVLG
jgi:hypothetical protein